MFEKGDIMETIRNVDVNRLHDFKNHPFKVEMNTELCELMRSIEKEGVLVPLLVRTNPYGCLLYTSMGLPIVPSFIVCIIANMLPVPIIYLFARKVLSWGADKPIIGRFFSFCLEKGEKGGKKLQAKAGRGLFLSLIHI